MRIGITGLMSLFLLVFLLPLMACQSASANDFRVLSLELVPNKVFENDKFIAVATINNAGKHAVIYIVPVMVDGIAEDRTTITLAPGKSQEIKFTLHRSKAGRYEIRIGEKSSTVFVEKLVPAAFKLSDLYINMGVANPGEEVVITARVENTGGSSGAYVTELKINGVAEQSDRTVMSPGSSNIPVFKVTKIEPGTYTVGIGELSGQFIVQKPIETIQVIAPVPELPKRYTQRICSPGG